MTDACQTCWNKAWIPTKDEERCDYCWVHEQWTNKLAEVKQLQEELDKQNELCKQVAVAICSAATAMATSSRDHSICRRDAWVYGILLGWGGEDSDDELDTDAWEEIRNKHRWSAKVLDRAKGMRTNVKQFMDTYYVSRPANDG